MNLSKCKEMGKSLKFKVELACIMGFTFLNGNVVKADDEDENKLEGSLLVSGTKKLITDATAILTGISFGVTVLLLIYQFFRLQSAEDEGDSKVIKKKMKKTAICGIGITLVSGMLTIILGYFK